MGLHLLTENPDGRFTETYYKGGDGNLFKQAWPGLTGAAAADQYASLLVTNEDSATVGRMMNLTAALQAASNDWELVEVMEEYLLRSIHCYIMQCCCSTQNDLRKVP